MGRMFSAFTILRARTRNKLFFADFSLKEHYFQNFYVSLPLEHWLMVLMEQETVKFYFFSLASAEVRQCDFRG